MKNIHGMLLIGCSALALAGCGADDVASSGSGGDIIIENPTPTPTPTPTGGGTVTAADSCPTFAATGGLTNDGIISGPEGTWRVCTLPALVDKSSALPKIPGVLYRLNGRVDVGCDGGFSAPTSAGYTTTTAACGGRSLTADTNVTLNIDPGVIIYGDNTAAVAWLAVNRGNKLMAEGTASKPIIFTSRQNVVGLNTESSQGQWGGVVLLGRGITTDCNSGSIASGSTANSCVRDTEGSADPAAFGGNDNTYNAGSIKYVQIRYSGFVLGNGKELQSLTAEAVGDQTKFDYFQSVNSSDDGAEFFGGKVLFKHYISVNADDDSLDIDTGLQGFFQYVMLLQRDGAGDAMMEIDSDKNIVSPRQKTAIVNFFGYQPNVSTANNEANDQASVLIRGNADVTWANGIIVSPNNECLRMNGEVSAAGATDYATLKSFSTLLQCNATKYLNTGTFAGGSTAQTSFASGTDNNNDAFTATLSGFFATPTGTAYDVKTISSLFDTATYIGPMSSATDTWFKGWTCDTATANFGSGSACTALPTT